MPKITVATVGDPTTVRTVDRFEDLLPAVIEGRTEVRGDGCQRRKPVQLSGQWLESVHVPRLLPCR